VLSWFSMAWQIKSGQSTPYFEFSSAAANVVSVVGNNEDVLNFFDLKIRMVAD